MTKIIKALNILRGSLRWIILGVVLALLAYGAFTFLPENGSAPTKVSSSGDSMYVAPSPLSFLENGEVLTTDKDGNTQSHGDTPENKEPGGTLRIGPEDPGSDSTGPAVHANKQFVELAIERDKNSWFPDLKSSSRPVRTLNQSNQKVVYTPPSKGFIEWDLRPSLGFGVVSMHPSVVAGASPLRVGPVRLGAYVSVPTRKDGKAAVMLDLSTRFFDHLETGIGVTHRQNLAFSVRYRF
jgi:hypothetical protein